MANGGIGSGETFCHARSITTVSLATNTYCMMDHGRPYTHPLPHTPPPHCYNWHTTTLTLTLTLLPGGYEIILHNTSTTGCREAIHYVADMVHLMGWCNN